MKVRYLATYAGPSYGGYDALDQMDAFSSLADAEESMRRRQNGYDYVTTYKQNADQLHVFWESSKYAQFPGTSNQDTMELYRVHPSPYDNGQLYIADFPTLRLSIGKRGGVVRENY